MNVNSNKIMCVLVIENKKKQNPEGNKCTDELDLGGGSKAGV